MRRRAPSLVRTLTRRFILATVAGITVTALAYALVKPVEPEYELDELARRFAELAAAAVQASGDVASLVPDAATRAKLQRINRLHFRVYDAENRQLLFRFDGDGPTSVPIEWILDWHSGFFILRNRRMPTYEYGFVKEVQAENGPRVRVVAVRGEPELRDYAYWVRTELGGELVPIILPVSAIATLLAVFTVRHGLAPLQSISAQAAQLHPGSAERLDVSKVPEEVVPLVEAVNHAFDRLSEAFDQQRRFTAMAAHELRTPLSLLRARVDGLPEELPEKSALLRALERMNRLVDQLLAVSRLEGGQNEPDTHLDLREVVRSVVTDQAPLAVRQNRDVRLETPRAPVPVRANREALERAIGNLLENAVAHAPPGSVVDIRVLEDGTVQVRDRGPGLGTTDPENLFQPFVRGRDRRRNPGGAGLGLAIVRDVARIHRGEIVARNHPEGGAEFRLRIPPDSRKDA